MLLQLCEWIMKFTHNTLTPYSPLPQETVPGPIEYYLINEKSIYGNIQNVYINNAFTQT